jgi:DNA adenine methylase
MAVKSADGMTTKAIAPWFGGKRTMAPDIVRQLGKHVQYFEPFCGSMAVLFAKEPSRAETVNDLHRDLINLAKVLQDETAAVQLYNRLQRTIFDERLLEEAAKVLSQSPAPDEGADLEVKATLSAWARERLRRVCRQELQAENRKIPFLDS